MEFELKQTLRFQIHSWLCQLHSLLCWKTPGWSINSFLHKHVFVLGGGGVAIYQFGIQEAKTAFNNFLFYEMEP